MKKSRIDKITDEMKIEIFYSEANRGYIYNIYNGIGEYDTSDEAIDNNGRPKFRQEIDGGLCTGKIIDALEMAVEQVRVLIK